MSDNNRDHFLEFLVDMLTWLCETPGGPHTSAYPGMTKPNIEGWREDPTPIVFPKGFLRAPRVKISSRNRITTYHSMNLRLSLSWLVKKSYLSRFEAQRLGVLLSCKGIGNLLEPV
jgi:hypothetical protein